MQPLQAFNFRRWIEENRAALRPPVGNKRVFREGEILLLPPHVPHSPQRRAATVGLVIERQRRPGELDGFQWYCESCGQLLYQEFFELTDIEKQFPPL